MIPGATPYPGGELDLFREARHWKSYWSSRVAGWVSGDVLEVGAGLGANMPFLMRTALTSWTCLEPDKALAERLQAMPRPPVPLLIVSGTLDSLPPAATFDSILYIDVLEHIDNDQAELRSAAARLRSGGALIVLAPAHQFLFSAFDRPIGHYRRYDKVSLRAAGPETCTLRALYYLDSIGMLASLANRWILRQPLPTARDVACWDSYMVPASRLLDPVTGRRIGKSIVAVWTKG